MGFNSLVSQRVAAARGLAPFVADPSGCCAGGYLPTTRAGERSGVTHLEDHRPKDIAIGCSDRHDEKYQCSAMSTSATILDHCHHFRMVGQPSAARQPKAARQSAGILAFRWLFNDASPVFPLRGDRPRAFVSRPPCRRPPSRAPRPTT